MLGSKEDKLGQKEGDGFSRGRVCTLSSGALWDLRCVEADIYTHYMVLISVTVVCSYLPAKLHGGCHYSL